MPMIDAVLDELEHESRTTRRLLERVPDDRLTWKPHPRSFTLGQLALHIASIAPALATLATPDAAEPPTGVQPQPADKAEILAAMDRGLDKARTLLRPMDDGRLQADWTLRSGGRELMKMPRAALLRTLMLNQHYHHRGQLTVYLRQLDVPLPPVYGPTADEKLFS